MRELENVDAIVASAEAHGAGRRWLIAVFPGADLASPRHCSVLLRGAEGLEERVLTLALVDASAPERVTVRELPWYLQAVLLSQPLHFGDDGGGALRALWTLFALASIALALSGLVSFGFSRARRSSDTAAVDALHAGRSA